MSFFFPSSTTSSRPGADGRFGPLAATLCLVSVLAAHSAAAHEFYLHPSAFRVEAGERIALGLEVGHAFTGSPVERRPGHLRRFVAVDASGEARPVSGVDGAVPAGWIVDAVPGLLTVSYESEAMLHEMPGERFESYLLEEGLDAIADERRARGERDHLAREIYSRCAKTLVEVGAVDDVEPGEMPVVGCPLELVPGEGLLAPEASSSVQVLWGGAPLEGVLVRATRAGDETPSVARRSDEDGRVELDLGRGRWLVHAVHMTETAPAGDDGESAEWRSVWSSLTFERP